MAAVPAGRTGRHGHRRRARLDRSLTATGGSGATLGVSVAAPFPDVALPTVDPLDIAKVAAVVLRRPGRGDVHELTGPAPISPRQQAAALGAALGEPVRFVEQTRAEAAAVMPRSLPAPVVDATPDLLGDPPATLRRVSPDVEHVFGRPPRSFADWAARTVAAFR